MTKERIVRLTLAVVLFSSLLFPRATYAEVTFTDAVMTVGVATVGGAVLGASTLPFYDDSGAHTKNIFYGAAFGAVVGVFVSAYAGVQEGPADEDALLLKKRASQLSLNEAPERRLVAESSVARHRRSASSLPALFWAPLAQVKF